MRGSEGARLQVKVVEEFVRLPIWFGQAGETLADTILFGESDQVFGLFEDARRFKQTAAKGLLEDR